MMGDIKLICGYSRSWKVLESHCLFIKFRVKWGRRQAPLGLSGEAGDMHNFKKGGNRTLQYFAHSYHRDILEEEDNKNA